MKLIIRATNSAYHKHIQDEANAGRLPLALLTFGFIDGHGWGFLYPWAQKAIFPAKGTPAGIGDRWRHHRRFIIVRWHPFEGAFKDQNHDYYIQGRYWRGFVWRSEWGLRWGFWPKFREVILDPDIVTYDPGQSEDWDGW